MHSGMIRREPKENRVNEEKHAALDRVIADAEEASRAFDAMRVAAFRFRRSAHRLRAALTKPDDAPTHLLMLSGMRPK